MRDSDQVAHWIAASAPLARTIADALCATPTGGDDCGALHGVWLDLRRLGLAADPERHAAFFANALDGCIGGGSANRVLVSGCADWGMLATVARAYRLRDESLDVTVVDRCPTPLLMCAWFGSQTALPVRTAIADLGWFSSASRFDLVCTHSLLTYAPLEARRQLVANWHRLLRPGGAVVTVTRLDLDGEAPSDDPASRARAFGDRVVARCTELEIDVRIDVADLRARAERFAIAQVSHRIGGEHELRSLFEGAGFEIVRLDVRRLEGVLGKRGVTGAARSNVYGELVAVRQ